MARKRYKPEEIVGMLRHAEVLHGQGMSMADAIRQLGISEVTFYRWRKEGIVTLTAWLRHGRCFSVSGCARYPTVVTAFHRSSSSMPSGSIAVSR